MKLFIKLVSVFTTDEKLSEMFPDKFIFKGKLLKIERAPEPSDIQW